MKYFTLISVIIFYCQFGFAQTGMVIDFENFNIPDDSFLNGDDQSGGFEIDDFFLYNDYNTDFQSWSGWAITNVIDTTTAGFTNQYASIGGSGNDNSANYAVSFVLGNSKIKLPTTPSAVNGLFINNATYAYLSMRDGDSFAKKFGGPDGTDPDFFLLTIKAYINGEVKSDSIDFYLADFRSDDNTEDYIVDEWTWLDISSIGECDSLQFNLSSSDNGAFGMNTPAYFCIDDIYYNSVSSTSNIENDIKLFPNPTSSDFYIQSEKPIISCQIIDMKGQIVHEISKAFTSKRIQTSHWSSGLYYLVIHRGERDHIVKKISVNN